MALGDLASGVTCQGSLSLYLSYTCPQCHATNQTTPTYAGQVRTNEAPVLIGVATCSSCGAGMLVRVNLAAPALSIEQVNVP